MTHQEREAFLAEHSSFTPSYDLIAGFWL